MQNSDIQLIQEEVKNASAFLAPLRQEMANVIVGQRELVDGLLIGLLTNGHILVEGVPGLAKTLAVKTLASVISGDFSRIQFTPDLLPADVTGTTIYNQNTSSFSIKKGPIFANIVLADEINRAPAKVQAALLEAMQERQVTIGNETYPLPKPFLVMATQNPLDQEGTYQLPEAQVDRFILKLEIGYPTREEEYRIIKLMAHTGKVVEAFAAVTLEDIEKARNTTDKIYLDDKIADYILDIVFATRKGYENQLSERQKDANLNNIHTLISTGASPRASLSLVLAAKAKAFLSGRAYVVPQDVKDIAPSVLRHRIIPSYEAEAEELSSTNLVQMLLNELRTP
ncbi:MAG: AAA family ATPase [Lentisphaeria bacterium]